MCFGQGLCGFLFCGCSIGNAGSMGAVCGCIRATALSSLESVERQTQEPEFAHESGALTGACEVPQTMEVAEANNRRDNNKRVIMEARGARVEWLQKVALRLDTTRLFSVLLVVVRVVWSIARGLGTHPPRESTSLPTPRGHTIFSPTLCQERISFLFKAKQFCHFM